MSTLESQVVPVTTSVPMMPAGSRIDSVDIVRGLAMVFMALDHVRYFFTNLKFSPENLAHTNLPLFITRWVTHFCAPAFFLLAGTGAYLSINPRRPASAVASFMWKRGLWLVALELTLIGFAWQFWPGYSFAGVIWCLGVSMILLAPLVRFPATIAGVIGILLIAGHDVFDRVQPAQFGPAAWLWSILHQSGDVHIGTLPWFVLFPIVPWVGVMGLGFWLGTIYRKPAEVRGRLLIVLGAALTALFVLMRVLNLYGNPTMPGSGGASEPFHAGTLSQTLISLLNVQKYPPSLQFLLMTLGPIFILLGILDRMAGARGFWARALEVFGRVPMFYYVLHLYLIHLLALMVAVLSRQPYRWLGWSAQPIEDRAGYGHGLLFIYFTWLVVIAALYFPCRWFMRYKKQHDRWWLRYL